MNQQTIKMYGAPWCPDCRRAKQFFGDQRVQYEWINVDDNPDSMKYVEQVNGGKQIIPTIVFEDGSVLVEPTNAELAEKLGIQPKATRQYFEVIIIGSGPAGLTAAIYAAREGFDTLVIERSGVGGQTGVTERIDNYPGFPDGVGGADLADQLRTHAERFGVEILPAQAVSKITTMGDYRLVTTETGDEYCTNAVIVATGSRYRRLNVPGEEDLIGAGIHFCATCDGPFYKGREVVVVGGGNSGIEESLFLTKFVDKVTVLEFGDQLRASRVLQETAAKNPKIEIRLRHTVREFKGNGRLTGVIVEDLESGNVSELDPAAVFIFIGLDPNTSFLKDSIDIDKMGFIQTSPTFETSVSGVFATGDVRAGSTKQVASAVGEGATVALMVRQYLENSQSGRGSSGA
jgi:thioredoxin reductase (NADPH)